MITVYWIPINLKLNSLDAEDIIYLPPESAYKYFLEKNKDQKYLKCPAFVDYLKNTYIIKAPYDIDISIDETGFVKTNKFTQEFFEKNITWEQKEKNKFVFQVMPRYFFVTKSKLSVKISVSPMLFQKNDFAIIPGEFDISKWIRPINCAFEVFDVPTVISFKREQPLFMVKFETDSKEQIELKQKIINNEIVCAGRSCSHIKDFIPKKNLNYLYKIAEGFINLIKEKI